MTALSLFVGSCFATVAYQSLKTQLAITASNTEANDIDEELRYINTLKELFNPYRHGTSKLPSRHVGDTETIFQQRKDVFSSLLHNCRLKNPKTRIIHVAGTKGKGSTVEYIASGIIENSFTVGVFTSPHMHTACERVRINRQIMSRKQLIRYGNIALDLLNPYQWTVFFDLLVAVALLRFQEFHQQINQPLDFLLLETGIGGRYDTTNFCDDTAVCVITSISLDHQNILGDTYEEIAWQKAGIIKKKSKVFTPSTQLPSVLKVIRAQCELMEADLIIVPPNRKLLDIYQVRTVTDVQIENASLAVAVLQYLKVIEIPPLKKSISAPLFHSFFWPCRFECFNYNNTDLIVDGAHNEDSVRRFLKSVRSYYRNMCKDGSDGKVHMRVLFGAGQDKCLQDMSKVVFDEADSVVLVQAAHFRALAEAQLWDVVCNSQSVEKQQKLVSIQLRSKNLMTSRVTEGTVGRNLQWATNNHPSTDKKYVVAICGSLFVASETRQYLFSMAPTLFAPYDWVRSMDPPLGL